MCTLLMTLTVACLVQGVSWPGFNMHSSDDTDCGLSCSDSELSLFLMCAVLVTLTVAYLLSVCELAGSLMCTLLVTMAVLFQYVSWPGL